MIQDIADEQWMLSPQLEPAFLALQDSSLCFEALVKPHHLKHLYTLLRRYPHLNVVINHGAKPNIANNAMRQWASDLSRIATDTQAFCKLSGLITETSPSQNYQDVLPFMDCLLQLFGANRLMWGSDWPVIKLASEYQDWVYACEQFFAPLEATSQAAVWSGTACSFYNIEPCS